MAKALIYERNTGEFVDYRYIMKKLSVSKSTAYRWMKEGRFGTPVKIGATLRIRKTDVNEAIENAMEDFDFFQGEASAS